MNKKALIWIIIAIIVIIAIVAVVNDNQSDTDADSGADGQETYRDFDAGGDDSVFDTIEEAVGELG